MIGVYTNFVFKFGKLKAIRKKKVLLKATLVEISKFYGE
jgi:hypothetical protein